MRGVVIVLVAALAGIVGAWVGYWIGHALGWTTDAVWPWQIGGGDGAILLSIGLSVLSVAVVGGVLVALPRRRQRRLLATGQPGHATIVKAWSNGIRANELRQLEFELEVHPDGAADYQAHATGMIDRAELDTYAPGVEVNVRYDPADPTRVAVEGLARPAPA
jgi:MFS family permease